jgi:hypothetical protein
MLKFKRIESGVYEADGYRVEKDVTGYVTIEQKDGDGLLCGCDDDGWAAIYPDGDQDWHDTKREAVAACNRHAERNS